ncbi:acetylxylan esterase [Streptomyces triticirhizae]|uniref:Acetylxylan esterase n=1 Tax=Streptomyces triticirhizae TaxID=2483353 RepID=A0A3M2M3G6_9ACTN|nr:acetylxylan esterase [Streptomyces triticirhizae]RMI44139.1 acetylxylan esterase [Streptomyces triticirhizae]
MALTDLSLDELRRYDSGVERPADFTAFWSATLDQARAAGEGREVEYRPVTDVRLASVDIFDVRFPGWDGQPVAAWLLLPRNAPGPLPAVVGFQGYGGGRGLPVDQLLWSAAGYAHLVVDSRGQGHDTPDPDPVSTAQWFGGFMTRGIGSREEYYYRRLMTDCVRAVEALREHPAVDPARVVVAGGSQGGGLALSTAGLLGDAVAAALVDVPFLCDYRRGADLAGRGPYSELVAYLGQHQRVEPARVFDVLAYFDGQHFAPDATAPTLFSVALMDPVCPPSTVYAAYNRYAGEKDITVWEFGDHGGGLSTQSVRQLEWLARHGLGATD